MAHFDLVQTFGIAGDHRHASDDRAGAAAAHAWMIDGATDLGPAGLMGGRGGAAWLAAAADRAFAATAPGPLSARIEAVFAAIARDFAVERVRDPIGRWELPSGAFLAVALVGDRLELGWLADCACLHLRGDVVRRIGPRPAAFETGQARAAQAEGLDLADGKRPDATLRRLRRNRERAGRRVLGVEPDHAAAVRYDEIGVRSGDELLLMTDGLAALFDNYGMALTAFAALLRAEGLAGLMVRLRAIEADDPHGLRYPRFKQSDDATGLWLRVTG